MPSHTISERRKRGLSAGKAKKMLKHGTSHGTPLTPAQKGKFGVVIGSSHRRKSGS